MKKYYLIIIVLVSTALMFAQTAEAPASGDGSQGNPYQISTWQNLYWIRLNSSEWGKDYIQTADITFPPEISEWDNAKGWDPIGNDGTCFGGNYDGNNRTINGLYINRSSIFNVGLFGKTYHAEIKNLGLINIDITGQMFTGGLVGSNNASSIVNCYCEGNLIGNDLIGGLAGASIDGSMIRNCYTTVNITSDNSLGTGAGGLVGHNGDATILDCESTGNIVSGVMVGGLVGINTSGTINRCKCSGNVTGDLDIGGLVGSNSNSSIIENCYTESNVTGEHQVGGFVGHISTATISDCFSRGKLSCETNDAGADAGSFIGAIDQGRILNCFSTDSVLFTGTENPTDKGFTGSVITDGVYLMTGNFWDMDSTGQISTIGEGEGLHTYEMKTDSAFLNAGWDFLSIWGMCDTINDGYPHLYWQSPVARIKILTIANITEGSANISGDLIHLGDPTPNQYGFCWNTNGDPSFNDDKVELGVPDSTGIFQTTLDSLSPNTLYYIRAYLITDLDTSYSMVKTFTSYQLPVVDNIAIKSIDSTTLAIEAEASVIGNPAPSMHGFCWNTTGNPTLSDSKKKLGSLETAGVFSANIRDLTPGTDYYICAYITNKAGTIYSDVLSFSVPKTGTINEIPCTYGLSQNYPNPFNPSTSIRYQLPENSNVEISIHDIGGKRIQTLVKTHQDAGYHQVIWNAAGLPSGVYFTRMKAGDFVETTKMLLMK